MKQSIVDNFNVPEQPIDTASGSYYVIDVEGECFEGPFNTQEEAEQNALQWFKDCCGDEGEYAIVRAIKKLKFTMEPHVMVVEE